MTASTDLLAAGTEALHRGAWEEARDHFQSSLTGGETPQALEQLDLAEALAATRAIVDFGLSVQYN